MKQFLLMALMFFSVLAKGQEPARTKAFVKKFTDEKFTACRKMMNDEMKKTVSLVQMKLIWNSLEKQFGTFEKTAWLSTETNGESVVSQYSFILKNAAFTLQVSENAGGKINGFYVKPGGYQMPDYAANVKFGKENVVITTDTFNLPGEILIPLQQQKPPLVILVHGSGPNDRDETIGPNKIFYDLALGLAANGVATLRYDKRTKVYKSLYDSIPFDLYAETIADAINAVKVARKSDIIDTSRIVVLGHSLGAMAAPYISNHSDAIGTVMMAGPFRSLADIIPDQYEYIASSDGKISKAEKKQIAKVKQNALRIKQYNYDSLTPPKDLVGYWWGSFFKSELFYSATYQIPRGEKPLLILQGSRDYQVTADKEFTELQHLCDERNNCLTVLYPGLNHLFIYGEKESLPAEYFIPGNVDERVIKDIAVWVKSLGK